MQVHYPIGDLHVYIAARPLYKQRKRNRQHLMREYMKIGLQYSIESLLMLNKKQKEERKKETDKRRRKGKCSQHSNQKINHYREKERE